MKRVMAIATAAAALFLSLQVGSAQQPSSLRFNATTANDLRTWDQFVSAQERAGGLRVTQVEQDPSLPSRTVERMQQYYQGIPVWGAEVVRDSDGGVPVSIFGDVSAQLDLDTQPALTVDAATKVFLSSAASATLLRPVNLVVFRLQSGEPRLAYTSVVAGTNQVFRVFIDARSGAELLRYSLHSEAGGGRHRAWGRRRHEEDVRAAPGRRVPRGRPAAATRADDVRHAGQLDPRSERVVRRAAVCVGRRLRYRQQLDGRSPRSMRMPTSAGPTTTTSSATVAAGWTIATGH